MSLQSEELLDKIRKQFDFGPYPRISIEASPKEDLQALFNLNAITPYYLRNQRTPKLDALNILDLGCGTGYETLRLAHANPGSRIVGIDISKRSIELAKARFQHAGLDNAVFYVLDINELAKLEREFDYINCDELLYLFPNPAEVLSIMGSVLKPEGIIRSNLHSSLQRSGFFRAQEMFRMMGLMDENPERFEIELAIDIMKSIKASTDLRRRTYPQDETLNLEQKSIDMEQHVLMNLLFQGDRGYTIPDLFRYLDEASLEFISMVNPRQWEILDLFKESYDLPAFLSMGLESISVEERLHLFELIDPKHRLLDFWCGHPQKNGIVPSALPDWSEQDWSRAIVHLHPQLRASKVKKHVLESLERAQSVCLSQFLPLTTGKRSEINCHLAAALLPLWDKPCSFNQLVEQYLKIYPVNLITAAPVDAVQARAFMRQSLMVMELYMHVMLEPEAQ